MWRRRVLRALLLPSAVHSRPSVDRPAPLISSRSSSFCPSNPLPLYPLFPYRFQSFATTINYNLAILFPSAPLRAPACARDMNQCVPGWDLDDPNPARIQTRHNPSPVPMVPMPDFEVAELTWENGNISSHGLGASHIIKAIPKYPLHHNRPRPCSFRPWHHLG